MTVNTLPPSPRASPPHLYTPTQSTFMQGYASPCMHVSASKRKKKTDDDENLFVMHTPHGSLAGVSLPTLPAPVCTAAAPGSAWSSGHLHAACQPQLFNYFRSRQCFRLIVAHVSYTYTSRKSHACRLPCSICRWLRHAISPMHARMHDSVYGFVSRAIAACTTARPNVYTYIGLYRNDRKAIRMHVSWGNVDRGAMSIVHARFADPS